MAEKRKNRRIENEAAEQHNLYLAGASETERESERLQRFTEEESGPSLPDLWPSIEKAQKKPKAIRPRRRFRKAAIAAALFLTLNLGGFTGYKIYEMQQSDREKSTRFTPVEQVDMGKMAFEISSVPEGYILESVEDISDGVQARYVDENGQYLLFICVSTELSATLDNEAEQESIALNQGNRGELFNKDGAIHIFWRYEDSFLSLIGTLDKEEMIHIAKSVITK